MYTDVFEPVELSPIDFLRLVDLGERREFRPRDTLSEAGKMQEDVLIILEGTAEVSESVYCTYRIMLQYSRGRPRRKLRTPFRLLTAESMEMSFGGDAARVAYELFVVFRESS